MIAETRHPPVVVLVEADLEIDGDRYRVSRNEHPTYTAYMVRKVTGDRGGEVYECRRFRDGRLKCNCKDAQCRKRYCKHTLALIRVAAFPPPVDPAEVVETGAMP